MTKLPKEIQERLKNLSHRQKLYFMSMWPKSGVVYLSSKPGIGKSAITRDIANKMGFHYMDIRLSMIDETDVGLFPNLSDIDVDGDTKKCLDFVVPKWAIEANRRPTIIHFEELNRAQLSVRNAALQILLERQIGTEFKFNDWVLMISSGNLGDDDGTDVEEFDAALKNRLIYFRHDLLPDEWIKEFAQENCHPIIVNYIRAYPDSFYKTISNSEESYAYATPRSWKFLSDYIITIFGMDSKVEQFLPYLKEVAYNYIGPTAKRFIQYCEDLTKFTILDVINDFDNVEHMFKKFKRDKSSEFIQSLKEMDFIKFEKRQLDNIVKFLKRLDDDEVMGYLIYLIDRCPNAIKNKDSRDFFLNFERFLTKIEEVDKLDIIDK